MSDISCNNVCPFNECTAFEPHHIWAALHQKVPNVLSRPFFGMTRTQDIRDLFA